MSPNDLLGDGECITANPGLQNGLDQTDLKGNIARFKARRIIRLGSSRF